jgi:hypothetical protein
MSVEITLQLSEGLLEQAQQISSASQTDVSGILTHALESLCLAIEDLPGNNLYIPVTALSNEEVLALADLKMDAVQNQRLGELQSQGKISPLSQAEQYELLALMQVYRFGQLRKSEALAEAVQRGLRAPLRG